MRPIGDLAAEICTLAAHINAATHRWLLMIAEFDRRKGWNDGGTKTCAHWLNWKCGMAVGAGREKLRVAHALAELPRISAAMERGTLSYSKAREITRVATPENETYLLEIAEQGTAQQVEKLVRGFRRCLEAAEMSREARQQQNRRVSARYDDDGSVILYCVLPAEVGVKVIRAIDIASEDVPAGTSGELVPFAARRADGLALVAESFLKHGASNSDGGDRFQIVVHVAEETLRTKTPGCCQIEDGPSTAAETARRFACDASVVALTENEDGEPLNLGRKTRTIPPALRRPLHSRDKGCRFPGCANARYIDFHHVKHWANGGETKPSNLISLCTFHHRCVHEGGFRIELLDDGAVRVVNPRGDDVEDIPRGFTPPRGDWTQLPKGTPSRGWSGDRMDYGISVAYLMDIDARRRNDTGSHAAVRHR
ncbi:MAG TPA: DUF222 domain-containing protein [Vicinamibacterales bacterium]|nr:DUF222 domain-containing protein [Vicinamibacterales bacterium]